ncbi:MAG: hypothetical protein RBT49_02325 [Bacteroidales bacterium]|nr:hypothetical protein [Bacteroidales bacterium]
MLPIEFKFLLENIDEPTPKIKVGDILFFGYNSLESFYDRFPLALVVNIRKRTDEYNILALNLHYIPPDYRLLFLDILKNNTYETSKRIANENIPRRYLSGAMKSYNVSNILTNIKVFKDNEINRLVNTMIPSYSPEQEVEIIKYLDKILIKRKY